MSLPAASWTIVVPEKLACDVFVGCMPLRAPAFAPTSLPSLLTHLGVQHYYTLVRHPSAKECMYYDFLPENPEDPLVIASVLSMQRVKGVVQEKKLQRPPRRKCWLVGKTQAGKDLESARSFNRDWDSRLSLFQHDCRHYTDGLVQCLTGKRDAIAQLDLHSSSKGLDLGQVSFITNED